MNKEKLLGKINNNSSKRTHIILVFALFTIGFALLYPNFVIGAAKITLTTRPTDESVLITWETKAVKADKFIIQKTTGEISTEIAVPIEKESYTDKDVFPRENYSYKIIAIKKGKKVIESNEVSNVILATADNPHGMYSSSTTLCSTCHTDYSDTEIGSNKSALCLQCHTDMDTEFKQLNGKGSNHPVMGKDSQLGCVNCHDPHVGVSEENPRLLRILLNKDGDKSIINVTQGDPFCFTCHDGNGISNKELNQELYLKGSAHGNLNLMKLPESGTKITCNSCHSPHASKYNSLLLANFSPNAKKASVENNQLCFTCHGKDGKFNILNFYNGDKDGESKGHYIKDKELAKALGVSEGWQLSCADCHSQHGANNSKMLSDILGDFTKIDDPVKRERAICTSCHAFSDKGEKSSFRGESFKALPDTVGHHKENFDGEVKSCTTCHGKGNIVAGAHAPKSGLTPRPPKVEEPPTQEPPTENEQPKVEEPAKEPEESTTPKEDPVAEPPENTNPTNEQEQPAPNPTIPKDVYSNN